MLDIVPLVAKTECSLAPKSKKKTKINHDKNII